jgi:signal transduction histidine kinase
MKEKNKIRWIPWLMGLSQALLTAFVIYWLVGQYNGEKNALTKEMSFEFELAEDQAMDSTIQILLKPILTDSLGLRDSIQNVSIVSHALKKNSWNINQDTFDTLSRGNQVITFDIRDSAVTRPHASASYQITAIPHRDIVMRGVKMIIEMSSDSAGKPKSRFSNLKVDSAVFLDIASERLKDHDHKNFGIMWYEDSLGLDSTRNNKRILFKSGFSDPGMIYEVTNYKPYLIKEILPQILFGLLLLILTASAFFFTYGSLRKQMMLNTLRNEFISNISHELKTPVSTVKVALESLRNYGVKNDRELRDDYLRMASLEMDRLDMLIQKILNQSLLESKQMLVNREKADLAGLINELAASIRQKIEEKGGEITIKTDIDKAILALDELYIQGVLINLLDNALKYGGSPPVIEVVLREDENNVYVDIKDNGTGIPDEFRQKVFERFFRVPSNDRHNVKGYGLGLSFAMEVMKQHEGSISLMDNPEGGSIFTLIFKKIDEN